MILSTVYECPWFQLLEALLQNKLLDFFPLITSEAKPTQALAEKMEKKKSKKEKRSGKKKKSKKLKREHAGEDDEEDVLRVDKEEEFGKGEGAT